MRALTVCVLFGLLLGCSSDSSEVLEPPAECSADADCDDGIWCNGLEYCGAGTCIGPPTVPPPCVGDCDEADQACTYEITASFLATTFGGEGEGTCLAVGPPAAGVGSEISVHPLPDNTLVRTTLATDARSGDVITFSQLFRQNATSGSGRFRPCHFTVLVGQELTLIETGHCRTDEGDLECSVTFDGIPVSDL